MDDASCGSFLIAADHPCLPGHFPGRPVVPGVVLLDEALALLFATRPGARLGSLRSVRFRLPVLPGQRVEVRQRSGEGAAVQLACRHDDETVLTASVILA
ncbi:3-hydroxyacyl-ACP dehydratase FabZ family protein [Lichenicoccus roseus]|uniref:ApeI dehydratase-like domain-containing protein n=1 Tax=Lichenicoccus roseus TaxID=2683649 RepID=A0A5R9JC46_9PROT|nr:hypothetical protein [Lichenicoccus roseus]TLU74107.1 hypothetical protein FE263_02520 [Lichenicoccus roseus]